MTNHNRFVQVFKSRNGQEFETKPIRALMLEESDITPGSILPNDHAEGNKSSCECAGTDGRIFNRITRGMYRVRQNLLKRV